MKLHFCCEPLGAAFGLDPLDLSWDPIAGTVSGPGAETILEMVAAGVVPAHPPPQGWELSDRPLKSWVDMAAMVGSEWALPDELRPYYPETDRGMTGTDDRGQPLDIVY